MTTTTHKSACILCNINCGVEIEVDQKGQFVKITGDDDHPISQGYICQKATRMNYYQNQKRLSKPLKRNNEGGFDEVSWDQAIQEIADQLVDIRDTHGGETIAYAGGGGQGNHFPGVFASATRAACQTPYFYSALAQEKTGNFWVHGKLFGKQNAYYHEPVDKADYVILIGTNPLQSHGFHRARKVINQLSRDEDRTLVVVDPRVTETAKKADHHLQVLPGRDAYLMSAMIGLIVQEGLQNQQFIDQHTVGYDEIKPHFMMIPVDEYLSKAGLDSALVRQITKDFCAAKTAVIRSDLGIEMSYNSTLNAYLKRLLFLLAGHFGTVDTNHLVTFFFPLLGHSKDPEDGGVVTQVTGAREIGKLFPPNVLPQEIDNDHPKRTRALIVESANPLSSYADIPAQKKAYKKLDLMVVIDVAMTETARAAHYVLPASSQFEKSEATFFTSNFMHVRDPLLAPYGDSLPESEIHSRLVKAMGELPATFDELETAARADVDQPGKGTFQMAFMKGMMENPSYKKYGPIVLRESLGTTLPKGKADAAFLWFSAQMYAQKYRDSIKAAGITDEGDGLANAVFKKIINSPSGVKVGKQNLDNHWDLVAHKDGKIHLYIAEMLEWMDKLPETYIEIEKNESKFPFNLIAGERRAYNANTTLRDPEWRKNDKEGFLKINPLDAAEYDIANGELVRCANNIGTIEIAAKLTDEMQRGVMSMPNAYGLVYNDVKDVTVIGAAANMLTDSSSCDPLAKTPYHKNVRVRLEKIVA